jgi:phosphoribosylamine--glycine ligase
VRPVQIPHSTGRLHVSPLQLQARNRAAKSAPPSRPYHRGMVQDRGRLNVVLMGGGGREHSIAAAMKRSDRLGELYVTHPQNPGLAGLGKPVDVPVNIREVYRFEQFCDHKNVGLVVIGPEEPLAEGFADKMAREAKPEEGLVRRMVFGPTAAGAKLEADKAWAKALMRSAALPIAEGRVFTDPESAKAYLESRETAQVVKASGLAKGKGVVVPRNLEEALAAVDRMMVKREFGEAGREIVIEEKLGGAEVSVLALVDGGSIYVLEPCQDHKRLGEGDTGPNTGGMGAYCPSTQLDEAMMARVQREILVPMVDTIRREGIDYRGVLYAGLMLTPGGPKVLEFNCRFGDPECQALLPRMKTDLLEIMLATCERRLGQVEIEWEPGASCCVVLASQGYPEKPRLGVPIVGVEEAEKLDGVRVFHAGTRRDGGQLVTAGGRVLNVVGVGKDLEEARQRAYAGCEMIRFEGKVMRRDIGRPMPAGVGVRAGRSG